MNRFYNDIKMELVKPRQKKLREHNLANAPYNNYIYYGTTAPYQKPVLEEINAQENENKPKVWCQSGVKDLTKEHEKQRRKYYEKTHPITNDTPSYVESFYDKHLYFGADYVILCRFQMKYIVDYSKTETKPNIDLEHLKRFMNTYVTDTVLRTPGGEIHSSKTGFTKINEYVIRGLFNITLWFGGWKSQQNKSPTIVGNNSPSIDEKIKYVCQNPPYSLACLLINPNDDYHKQHPNGSQYKAYNLICSLSHKTQTAAKQELGEERGFYIMQMGQTFYLISHEICIKELSPNSAFCSAEIEKMPQNVLSFDNIAAMYTGCIKGHKIISLKQKAQNSEIENKIIYNVVWSKFYLSEITKETSIDIMQNISSFRTFVKPIRDEGYYIGHTALTPRQKLIFDTVTMFCDGLSVGFELKNI